MLLQLDEADYDARMGAYQRLLPAAWAGMARWQALPLLHHCLADLRNADDLALRHAAAQVHLHDFCSITGWATLLSTTD